MKAKFLTASALGLALVIANSNAALAESDASTNARITKLEEEIQLLKRQQEVKEEVATTAAAKAASVEFNKSGLSFASPDKNFTAKLSGYGQVDTRSFISDDDRNGKDDIQLRAIRPVLDIGLYKDLSFRISPDFGSGGYKLYDAYAQYKVADPLQFRLGKFKAPLGLERLQPSTDTFFSELGQTSNLLPNRDIGFMAFGDLIPDTLEYQIGLFDGGADAGNNDTDDDDAKDIMGRVFARPFSHSDIVPLQGLGLGVAGSIGHHSGSTGTTILPTFKTAGQSNFFSYQTSSATPATNAYAKGDSWRFVPQGYYFYNNFALLGEYVLSSQDVRRVVGAARNNETLKNSAWSVEAGYVLTGEDENYKGSVKPAENFDLKNGGWGAFELVARVGETNVDPDAFTYYANPATAANEAFATGIGVNWYWNENVRFMVDYENTSFQGGKAGGQDREDENVILTRLQFKFQ